MEPLASKIRPKDLSQFVGQQDLVGEGRPLRVAIEERHLFSFVLWGPPGTGKTTLARIYAKSLNADYHELSAVSAGKDDIKKIMEKTGTLLGPKVLFLDEIHRFNKAQQDYLLPFVESGALTLIGATTENPSFEVIPALLSRMRVFVLHELTEEEIIEIISRTKVEMEREVTEFIARVANGDARQALVLVENTQKLYGQLTIENVEKTLGDPRLRFDKGGDEHYNTISAFIKSMRTSQPDAALYYLCRMIESGEDLKFIARRMVIFASEDIGMEDPQALVLANAVFRAVETIGYPEANINLSHGVVYLSLAPKSKAAYYAYLAAMEDARSHGNLAIPLKIRNAPTKLMKELKYGEGYEKYTKEDLLPEKLKGQKYWKDKRGN
ncbi:MAG: replication-associated recombination protein A [bacterium]|nr:replication-associated recombination protein A [bacterium]